jgi:putative salt-induced outer membrane protein YdiY
VIKLIPPALLPLALAAIPPALAQTESVQLTLTNGDRLSGTLIGREAGVVVLRHESLGELRVAEARIAETQPVVAEQPAAEPDSGAPAAAADAEAGLLEPLLPGWERQFDLGVGGAEGNSQSRTIHGALTAKTESPEHRWDVRLAYDSAEKDGERSRQEFFAQGNRDWLVPDSPHFYFALGRLDWDDFQDWDYRINAAGGYGYEFVDRPDWQLRGKVGLGASREFGGEDDALSPEGLLGLESFWELGEHHRIEFATTLHPQFDEPSEYRNLTSLSWVNKLNAAMRLKIGLTNEYDSAVGEDAEHNDFTYTTALSWDI